MTMEMPDFPEIPEPSYMDVPEYGPTFGGRTMEEMGYEPSEDYPGRYQTVIPKDADFVQSRQVGIMSDPKSRWEAERDRLKAENEGLKADWEQQKAERQANIMRAEAAIKSYETQQKALEQSAKKAEQALKMKQETAEEGVSRLDELRKQLGETVGPTAAEDTARFDRLTQEQAARFDQMKQEQAERLEGIQQGMERGTAEDRARLDQMGRESGARLDVLGGANRERLEGLRDDIIAREGNASEMYTAASGQAEEYVRATRERAQTALTKLDEINNSIGKDRDFARSHALQASVQAVLGSMAAEGRSIAERYGKGSKEYQQFAMAKQMSLGVVQSNIQVGYQKLQEAQNIAYMNATNEQMWKGDMYINFQEQAHVETLLAVARYSDQYASQTSQFLLAVEQMHGNREVDLERMRTTTQMSLEQMRTARESERESKQVQMEQMRATGKLSMEQMRGSTQVAMEQMRLDRDQNREAIQLSRAAMELDIEQQRGAIFDDLANWMVQTPTFTMDSMPLVNLLAELMTA